MTKFGRLLDCNEMTLRDGLDVTATMKNPVAAAGVADPKSRVDNGRLAGLAALSLTLVLLTLPLYAKIIFEDIGQAPMTPSLWNFVYLSSLCNATVTIVAFLITGKMGYKITRISLVTLLVHGFLASYILSFRTYYSNKIFFTALAISLIIGVGTVVIKHRSHRLKIAVIGAGEEAIDDAGSDVVTIKSPEAELSRFDVILIPNLDIAEGWAGRLSQAMLAGRRVRLISEYREELLGNTSVDHFHIEHLPEGGITSYLFGKRVLDIVLVLMI
ncbi:MAG: hypothetical protein EOO82_03990, partial [Oxalobacteraceae bacterium]